MSLESPTLADVWELFRETGRMIQEMKKQFRETDRKFQENERKFQEQRQENDRRFQETERLIKEQSRETDRKIKKMSEELGRLGNRLRDFIEDAVRPAAVRLLQERGIDVHEVYSNIVSRRGIESMEVDLLVANDTDVVAIECKSHLTVEDIKDHLERLAKFKRLMPIYAQKRLLGAVAAMVNHESEAQYANRKWLYVIGQSGEQLTIRNSADFAPAVW